MDGLHQPGSTELSDYLGVLGRRWWVVVTLACLGLIASGAYFRLAPRTYTATAAVYVTPTAASSSSGQLANGRTSGIVNMDSEAQVVQSPVVAAGAARDMPGVQSLQSLEKAVSVAVPPNSGVLRIRCQARTPAGAASCAQAFAQAYLQNRSAAAVSTLKAQADAVRVSVNALTQNAATLTGRLQATRHNPVEHAATHAQLKSVTSQLSILSNRLASLTAQEANSSGGHILSTPIPPGQRSSPRLLLVVPAGVMAGLLIGLIAAFVLDRRDTRIHSARDVERYLDLSVLLSLPRRAARSASRLAEPGSEENLAFSDLGHDVAATLGEGPHVLAVTSASAGRGASIVAANLAVALAGAYQDVTLVCADPASMAPGLLGLSAQPGLFEILTGRADPDEVRRAPAGIPGLTVITPGAASGHVPAHLRHDVVQRLDGRLRSEALFTILETSATGLGAQSLALAGIADAALVVAEVRAGRRGQLANCLHRLARLRTPVLGAVLVAAVPRSAAARLPAGDPAKPSPPVRSGVPVAGNRDPSRAERPARASADAAAEPGPARSTVRR